MVYLTEVKPGKVWFKDNPRLRLYNIMNDLLNKPICISCDNNDEVVPIIYGLIYNESDDLDYVPGDVQLLRMMQNGIVEIVKLIGVLTISEKKYLIFHF